MTSFRVIPSHPEDLGKSRIRIESDQMKSLGISSGDAVLVTGTRTTVSICLPLDDKVLPHDPEYKFLYNAVKLPVARSSDVTLYNTRGHDMLSVVQIVKAEPVKAEYVTLTAKDIFSYKKENLELSSLDGTAFTKGDCVRVANIEQQTKFLFVEFVIVDASPAGNSYIITKNTKIDFAPYKTKTSGASQLSNLKKIIQIGKKISDKRLAITLESLEFYDEGCRFSLEVGYSLDDPREWVENKMYAVTSASDDTGKMYRCVNLRAGESHWNNGNPQYTRLSGILVPAIDENVSKIIFEIKEITWQVRRKRDLQFLDQVSEVIGSEPTVVSVWQLQKLYYIIASGPWKFGVDLK